MQMVAWIGWHARLHGRALEGGGLLALAAAQGLLGGIAAGLAATGMVSPAVLLAHNLGAATGLALVVGVMPPAARRGFAEA